MFIYVYRRNSRLVEAAREATATSKRLRTRLKSAKVRFDLNPEERKKNMRSSAFHHLTRSIRVTIIALFMRRLTTELLLTFLILINKQDWKAKS